MTEDTKKSTTEEKKDEPAIVASPSAAEAPTEGAPIEAPTGPINVGDAQMHDTEPTPAPPAPVKASPVAEDKDKKTLARLLKLTGLKNSDVAAYNPNSLTAVTYAGGKYQMNVKGTQIRHLAGPLPPALTADAEAEAQAKLEAAENARTGDE